MKWQFASKILLISSVCSMIACSNPARKSAERTIHQFVAAVKKNDTTTAYQLYPIFKEMESYFKMDTFEIKTVEYDGDKIILTGISTFTNIKKKVFNHQMIFHILNKNNSIQIVNSHGFCDYQNSRFYPYAVKHGLLKKSEIPWDLKWIEVSRSAFKKVETGIKTFMDSMRKLVPVEGIQWKKENGYYEGKASVVNHSKYPIYDLQYQVAFMDENHKILEVKDKRYVCYDTLKPGQRREVDFIHEEIKGAKYMDVGLVFDKYYLLNTIMD